jgi:hypothetical protein
MKSNHLVMKFVLLALMAMVSCKREEFMEMPVWDLSVRMEPLVNPDDSLFKRGYIPGHPGDTIRFNLNLSNESALPKFLNHRGPKPNSVLLKFELIHKAYTDRNGPSLTWSAGPDTILST